MQIVLSMKPIKENLYLHTHSWWVLVNIITVAYIWCNIKKITKHILKTCRWLYTLHNIFKFLAFERCQCMSEGSLLNSIHPLDIRALLQTHKYYLGTYYLFAFLYLVFLVDISDWYVKSSFMYVGVRICTPSWQFWILPDVG